MTTIQKTDFPLSARLKGYLIVTKPFIILMVLISTLSGMYMAHGAVPAGNLIFWNLLAVGLATGGAASLNNFIDKDIDRIMIRTRKRPIPSGKAQPGTVLAMGLSLSFVSVAISGIFVNGMVAFLNFSAIFIYVILYTAFTKRQTPMATYIGGVGGALPPVIGYAAIKPELDIYAFILFLLIFAWQHPHFWALALKYIDEYRAAGVQNHPVAMGVSATKRRIALWAGLMTVVTILPYTFGMTGVYYLVIALLVGGVHITMSLLFLISDSHLAMRIFFFSLAQLPILVTAMVLDIT